MRVLFFSTAFPQPDDPVQSPYNLHRCEALARLGHSVEVISPLRWQRLRHAPRALRRASHIGTLPLTRPVFFYPPGALHSTHAWFLWHSVQRSAAALVSRFRPDVVLSYWTYPDAAVASRIARRAGIPCVTMVGGSDVLSIDAARPDAAALRVRRVLESVDAIATVSDHLKERICALGVPAGKVHVLPAGVDTTMFAPGDRADARRTLGIDPDTDMLVWVGRMVEVKALDVLLAAVARTARTRPRLRLYLLGSGTLRGALEAEVREHGLSAHVVFAGRVPQADLANWYRAADLAVLPSHWEGTPNVLLEAHACGTPFVATRVGAIPQLAIDGVDELVPPGDPGALAAALSTALARSDPQMRRTPLGVRGWDETGAELARVLAARCHVSSPASAGRRYDGPEQPSGAWLH